MDWIASLTEEKDSIVRQLFCWKHRVVINPETYDEEGNRLIRRYHAVKRKLHAHQHSAASPAASAVPGQFTVQVDQGLGVHAAGGHSR